MAESQRMTTDEVVAKLLSTEHVDLVRESLRWVVGAVDGGRGDGPDRRRYGASEPPDRATHRNGYRSRGAGIPGPARSTCRSRSCARGSYFPSFLEPRKRSEEPLNVVQQADRLPAPPPARSTSWSARSPRGSRARRSRASRPGSTSRSRRSGPRPLEGRYPDPLARRQGREGPRRRPGAAQVPGHRPRGARVRPPRGDRHGCRRGRDGGVLARVPARPGEAWPRRRAARDLRRPRGPEGGDRPGPGLPLATLHGPFSARLPRPRPARGARCPGGADPADLQPGGPGQGPATGSRRPSPPSTAACPRSARRSSAPRRTSSPSTPSRPTTGRSCGRRTRWSGSTGRSAGAPTWSGSSPTTPP